jgi:hypothetical protein
MDNIKCNAKVDYDVEWTGTPEDLVDFINEISVEMTGQELDSHDLGDAMGFIMHRLDMAVNGKLMLVAGDRGRLIAERNVDTFNWENLPDEVSHA